MKQLLLIIFLVIRMSAFPQEFSGGISLCTLMPTVGEWYDIASFNPVNVNRHMMSAVLNYTPQGRHMFYNTGLSLMTRLHDQFLKVPMTVNVFFGDVIKGYLILGCYHTFRISGNDDLYRAYDFGINYGIGSDMKVTEKLCLFVEYTMYFGILPFQREGISGTYYTSSYAFLHCGFKYYF